MSDDRLPPHNIEAEEAVIGAVMLDAAEAAGRVLALVDHRAFYVVAHRKIFRAIEQLMDAGTPPDVVTIAHYLQAAGDLEGIGGPVFLQKLTNNVATIANATYYARIVLELAQRRDLLIVGKRTQDRVMSDMDVSSIADTLTNEINTIMSAAAEGAAEPMETLAPRISNQLIAMSQNHSIVTGLSTGYIDLDAVLGGMQKGELLLLAARPSHGKTALLLNIARRAPAGTGGRLLFSLEMHRDQLAIRMLASEANLNAQKIRAGFLRHGEWADLMAAAETLAGIPIRIDDSPRLTIPMLHARARSLHTQEPLAFVGVDYLQLMTASAKGRSREEEVGRISRGLKMIARDLHVPVLALAQLSRAVETRPGARPILSDLRESGSLEQDADVVMFLYHEHVYRPSLENEHKTDLIVSKHRNGPVGDLTLSWNPQSVRFDNLAATPAHAGQPAQEPF